MAWHVPDKELPLRRPASLSGDGATEEEPAVLAAAALAAAAEPLGPRGRRGKGAIPHAPDFAIFAILFFIRFFYDVKCNSAENIAVLVSNGDAE